MRYDAVANLIYRHGHTDDAVNDSGIWFLKNTNYAIQKMHPDVMLFAEDSTNYTKVTALLSSAVLVLTINGIWAS